MTCEFEILAAQATDLNIATAWLADAALPSDDLTATHMQSFLMARQAGKAVGMIGLESYSSIGLLRSLIVDESSRGNGLGGQLVAALERKARGDGLSELWLLTIDAEQFFGRLAYDVIERVDAPHAIKASAEFSSLCPGDAVLMRKKLA